MDPNSKNSVDIVFNGLTYKVQRHVKEDIERMLNKYPLIEETAEGAVHPGMTAENSLTETGEDEKATKGNKGKKGKVVKDK